MNLPSAPLVRQKSPSDKWSYLEDSERHQLRISPRRSHRSAARPSDGLPSGEFGPVGRLGDVIEHLPGLITGLAEQGGGPLGAARGMFNEEVDLSPQVLALKVERRRGRAQGGQVLKGLG